MTMARAHLVDPAVTRWYHCVSRCVRRAFLLGEGEHDRKAWIKNRIRELAEIFAVAGFAILDNHLHLLIRLDPHVADAWSDEEVVRRWGRLFPPRDRTGQPLPVSAQWVAERLANPGFIATARQRLQGPRHQDGPTPGHGPTPGQAVYRRRHAALQSWERGATKKCLSFLPSFGPTGWAVGGREKAIGGRVERDRSPAGRAWEGNPRRRNLGASSPKGVKQTDP